MIDNTGSKALLHMNGTDASTTITDESGKTWTAGGNAQIDTAQSKFGGASLLLDGTGDYVDTADHADFDVSNQNFTIECWLRRNATGQLVVCGQADSSASAATISWFLQFDGSNHLLGGIYSGTSGYYATSTGTITNDGNWHHVACVRNGNTITLYRDGTADGTRDVTGVTANNSANRVAIGRHGENNANYFNGWIDEFRFSNGIARFTANFTPPTLAYDFVGQVFVNQTFGKYP